jgi:hypothetical protein
VAQDTPIIFAELGTKLTVLRVVCANCDCEWNYPVRALIKSYGRFSKVGDWLDTITADCPQRDSANKRERCMLSMPGASRGFLDKK